MGVRAPATMTDVDTADLLASREGNLVGARSRRLTEQYAPAMDEILAAALDGAHRRRARGAAAA